MAPQPISATESAVLDDGKPNPSTGPKTAEGKAVSSQNALKHGLSSDRLLIQGESADEYEAFFQCLRAEWSPATPTEELLVSDMAKHHWLKDRALRIQGDTLRRAYPDITAIPDTFSVLLRYQSTNERAFARAKKQLEDMQRARREFVSQEQAAQPEQAQVDAPQLCQSVTSIRNKRKIRPETTYSPGGFAAQEATIATPPARSLFAKRWRFRWLVSHVQGSRVTSNTAILFDIDGTLVRKSGPHHRDALRVAVLEIFGIHATTDGVPVHGMLDQDIVTAMLERKGIRQAAIHMSQLREAAERYYLSVCPDLRFAVCPGVHPLLRRLQNRGISLALVTGNFTRIGWRKLECAGLAGYFQFGAFAEMASTRAGLAAIAARELGSPQRVFLVGDAPSDIEAAQANGFISVSVHTGVSSREELAALRPDYLVPSLRFLKLPL